MKKLSNLLRKMSISGSLNPEKITEQKCKTGVSNMAGRRSLPTRNVHITERLQQGNPAQSIKKLLMFRRL